MPAAHCTLNEKMAVKVTASAECPHYVGRIIRGIKPNALTPDWIEARLTDGKIKCIHPVVDVMNYVMLELGQPMHAFDLSKIAGSLEVRTVKGKEKIHLLDEQIVTLAEHTLVIADQHQPLAIAGVMGGLDSAVSEETRDVF